jgi:protein phosphatase
VGDSRLYLLRDGVIRRLSTDHTWVQEAVEQGVLTPEQIRGHPNQHVIRRYLGGPTPPEVDLRLRLREDEDDLQAEANQGLRLFPGDIILLTSDGLTDLVSDDEICDAYKAQAGQGQVSAQTAGHQLIDLANKRGGHDNITLVAISIPSKKMDAAARLRRWANRNWVWAASGCAVLLITLVIGLAGGWWWTKRTAGTLPTATYTRSAPVAQGTELPTLTPMPTAQANPPASFLTPTFTLSAQFPADSGPTLTPWPTNTP